MAGPATPLTPLSLTTDQMNLLQRLPRFFAEALCHCLQVQTGKGGRIKFLKLLEDKGVVLQTVKQRQM